MKANKPMFSLASQHWHIRIRFKALALGSRHWHWVQDIGVGFKKFVLGSRHWCWVRDVGVGFKVFALGAGVIEFVLVFVVLGIRTLVVGWWSALSAPHFTPCTVGITRHDHPLLCTEEVVCCGQHGGKSETNAQHTTWTIIYLPPIYPRFLSVE